MFWAMPGFINQSLVSLFLENADYTFGKHFSLKFFSDFYIKGTLFLSSKTFSVVIIIFFGYLQLRKSKL